ncbi:MAG: oligosaccharide flippase family protein, partial [Eubacteriales bacterium]
MKLILNNIFFSSITLGLRFLSTAILFIIMARVFGAEEFGRFAFAVSFTGIFQIIVDYGYNLLLVREVAASPHKASKIASELLGGKIVLSLFSSIALIIVIRLLHYPPKTEIIVYILWVSSLFYSFGLFFNFIFRGLNKFQNETYSTAILNGILFFTVGTLLYFSFDTIGIAITYMVARTIYFLTSLYLVNKKVGRIPWVLNSNNFFRNLKISFPFGIHAILGSLYFQIDTVF